MNIARIYRHRRIKIGSINTVSDYQAARGILTEHITDPSNVPIPQPPIERHRGLHDDILAAWMKDRLVGAIFISPGHQYGYDPKIITHAGSDYAQWLTESVAVIQSLAVEPLHRRKGIGTMLKNAATIWAKEHGAHAVVSIPTTSQSRALNTRCNYVVFPAGISLIIYNPALDKGSIHPIDASSTYAVHPLTNTTMPELAIGYGQPIRSPRSPNNQLGNVTWLN